MVQYEGNETYKGMNRQDLIQILLIENLGSSISEEYFLKLSLDQLIREYEKCK